MVTDFFSFVGRFTLVDSMANSFKCTITRQVTCTRSLSARYVITHRRYKPRISHHTTLDWTHQVSVNPSISSLSVGLPSKLSAADVLERVRMQCLLQSIYTTPQCIKDSSKVNLQVIHPSSEGSERHRGHQLRLGQFIGPPTYRPCSYRHCTVMPSGNVVDIKIRFEVWTEQDNHTHTHTPHARESTYKWVFNH